MKTGIELINECCEKHNISPEGLVEAYEHFLKLIEEKLPLVFISKGVELIAEERKEQIEKHRVRIIDDVINNNNRQLAIAACALVGNRNWKPEFETAEILNQMPEDWLPSLCMHMADKPYEQRLIIAGALIAAEIDRLQNS